MSWLFFSIICVLGWGLADLFYKKGSDEEDRNSHLRIAVHVGLVMGACSLVLLFFTDHRWSFGEFLKDVVAYSPASLSYIISMVIGYAGLRYLELSIISPVQNASGAFSLIAMAAYFMIAGEGGRVTEAFGDPGAPRIMNLVGTAAVIIGVILLAVVEKKVADRDRALVSEGKREKRKYRIGALALLFPLLYCVFDTIGTAADGIILDESSGLDLSEIDVLILYGLTFLLMGVVSYIILWVKEKRPYRIFSKKEMPKFYAAVAEEFGQIFYVYAMARNPLLSAPLVASYCIVSVILSRIFLRERLTKGQYLCVVLLIAGIVLLGVSEGLAG